VAPTLVESELFGHVRGSFSGAIRDRPGAFEAANGGTLFLDEIGELPIELQPKLLRALERYEIKRLGSNEPTRVDVRIIAATNRNLEVEVAAKRFREDLFYRLAVLRIELPPLRQRADDVPLLARHFASSSADLELLTPAVLRDLASRPWPGNVRELRNAVRRVVSSGPPLVQRPLLTEPTDPGVDLTIPLKAARDAATERFERAYVEQALRATDGNVSHAARLAGVNRKFIQRAMVRYGLRAPADE
jgi:transcriptional regulator with GAF, ATPase, and Fis domain